MLITANDLLQQGKDLDQVRLALQPLPTNTELPDIAEASGVAADSAVQSGGGGGGISLGAETTYTFTTTDGLFTFTFPARSAVMSDATTVMIPTLPVQE